VVGWGRFVLKCFLFGSHGGRTMPKIEFVGLQDNA